MTFQLRTGSPLYGLHCCVALSDWDMDKELKLTTTTDQLCYEDKLNDQHALQRPSARLFRRKEELIWYDKTSDTFVKPNLWLLVNPNIACPPPSGGVSAALRGPEEGISPSEERKPDLQHLAAANGHICTAPNAALHSAPNRDCNSLKPGCWPRPPVNYCILIALALKSSPGGSLKVQQIYAFTREHFPFFQTAPDGWKNTIRHNLCFNGSFRKTCNQMCKDGKRKSCFWHLTLEGHRRLKDDILMLTGEALKRLERSMSHPDIIWSILAM